ncbi:hypothetical protein M0812_02148 [Anaeramoeba flamelloides]|uniref:Transmembrane protein n=1 Tax=Anaeramoeba flamelloides TaxID=1746091 RepID=A0AAV7Z4H2_9EUKA|nr:hypothetical protein M0812_02148 [Anaeramoeba flamelloides]
MTENQLPEQAIMQFGLIFVSVVVIVIQTSIHYHRMSIYGNKFLHRLVLRMILIFAVLIGAFLSLQAVIPVPTKFNHDFQQMGIALNNEYSFVLHLACYLLFFLNTFLHMIFSLIFVVFFEKISWKSARVILRITCLVVFSAMFVNILFGVFHFVFDTKNAQDPLTIQQFNFHAFSEIISIIIIIVYFRSFKTELKVLEVTTLADSQNQSKKKQQQQQQKKNNRKRLTKKDK